jgi:hypothetical protein
MLVETATQGYRSADQKDDHYLFDEVFALDGVKKDEEKGEPGQIIRGKKQRAHQSPPGGDPENVSGQLVDSIGEKGIKICVPQKSDEPRDEDQNREQNEGFKEWMFEGSRGGKEGVVDEPSPKIKQEQDQGCGCMRGVFEYPEKIGETVDERKKTDEEECPVFQIDRRQDEHDEEEREEDELKRSNQGNILDVKTVQAGGKDDGDKQKNESSIHSLFG